MPEPTTADAWSTASAIYAAKAESITRPCAEQLITWMDEESPFSSSGTNILDNGAGTGVVTTSLRARFPDLPIVAADLSPGMLKKIEKKGLSGVKYEVVDSSDLKPFANDIYTHSLSTFMIQFAPQPQQALREMYRVTKPGGMLGLGMWKEFPYFPPWEDTVRQFEPDYSYHHTWTSDWSDGEQLLTYVQSVGFTDVRMKMFQPQWVFKGPEEC